MPMASSHHLLQQLPRSLQWHILAYLGWCYGDASELRQYVARRFCYQTVLTVPAPGMFYRYATPPWCPTCGEYRQYPCIKCTFCGYICYHLIAWS